MALQDLLIAHSEQWWLQSSFEKNASDRFTATDQRDEQQLHLEAENWLEVGYGVDDEARYPKLRR
jgi:DNA-binding IclR family transcriptional regulator